MTTEEIDMADDIDVNDAGGADAGVADTSNADTSDQGVADAGATDTVDTAAEGSDGAGDQGNADQGDLGADDQGSGEDGDQGTEVTGAPEEYADFTMPEGMEVDTRALEAAAPILKDLDLNQEQAQKLVDFYAGQQQAQVDAFNTMVGEWAEQSKNDSEFGGDKFDESIATAKMAVDKFGTPELKELLESHGVGNHPEVIRFMVKVGALTREDNPGSDRSRTQDNRSPEQRQLADLYPE